MSKARTLADIVAAGSPLVDGTIETTDITNVTASATELNYVDGVTSNVQTQLDTKVETLGDLGVTATATELNYVDGVTSAVQTQIDTKAPTDSPTFTGTVDLDKLTVNTAAGTAGQVLTSGGSGAAPSWVDAASGGEADFVASGTISNGDVVVLNSNGTVSTVTQTVNPPSVGSAVVFESGGSAGHLSSVYDSANQKVIIAYQDSNNSSRGTAIVGTVSGTSISFGTPVVFETDVNSNNSIVYDSTNQKVVICYRDHGGTGYGRAIVGTVSGTSISFGSAAIFDSGVIEYISATYDSANQKVVIAYSDGSNSDKGTAVVGTVSGTSISFGGGTVFNNASTQTTSIVYDSANQKVVISYSDTTTYPAYGKSIVGTVSGTSISFGSATTFTTDISSAIASAYDSTNQKVVISYSDNNQKNGSSIVGTVSGTSISFGTPVLFNDPNVINGNISSIYDPDAGQILVAFADGSNRWGRIKVATVSGTSISFGADPAFNIGDTREITLAYDTVNQKAVISYEDASSSNGESNIFTNTSTSTDAGSYIGLSTEDISDTATGTITIIGGINEGQTGLTVGSTYYVADDGSLSTTNNGRKVGKAISTTKILLDSAMSGVEMDAYLAS